MSSNSPVASAKFWGVRGSLPSPIVSKQIELKYVELLRAFIASGANDIEKFIGEYVKIEPPTYGGNTSCVEVRYGKQIFILDMGTGMRPLGNSLMPQLFQNMGLEICCLVSHVHWDHVQGFPFFAPIYMNKHKGFRNRFHFYGGTNWQKTIETVLQGQMDPPNFPVTWPEIAGIAEEMDFCSMIDSMKATPIQGGPEIRLGKLNHPQETYGMRFEFPDGQILVYATDNEPFNPAKPDPRLLDLTKGADLLIVDCQYTQGQYEGEKAEGGVPRHGWGHSYPEAVAQTALTAGVKHLVLFHHDPAATDSRVTAIKDHTQSLIKHAGGNTKVTAAWEGLEIVL